MSEGMSMDMSQNGSVDDEQEAITRVVAAFKHAMAVRDTELAGLDDDGKNRLNYTINDRFLKPKAKTPREPKVGGARTSKR